MKKLNLAALLSLILLFNLSVSAQNGDKSFTLEDLMKARLFSSSGINEIRSMNDGVHYSALNDDYSSVEKFSYKTGEKAGVIVNIGDAGKKELTRIIDYEFSDDESLVLLQTSYEPIYRRSFKADYYIYNIKDKTFRPLSANGKQQLATFSPDGSKVAFVREITCLL